MAIKVGGTEVVDNNRQLKNIASVDSTTVAALNTAGVGGGGAYELIQKQTISSSVSSITFTNTTAPQEQLLLLFNGVTLSGQSYIRLNLQDSSGNNLTGGSYAGIYNITAHYHDVASSHGVSTQNNSQNFINLTEGATIIGGFGYNAHFFIFQWSGSGAKPHFSGRAVYRFGGNTTSFINNMIAANYSSSGATPARLYIYSGSNFTSGEIYLYKLV
jgi:hypothetical protein